MRSKTPVLRDRTTPTIQWLDTPQRQLLSLPMIRVQRIAQAVLQQGNSMYPLRTLLQQHIQRQHLPLGRVIGKGKQSHVYTLRQYPHLVAKEYYFTEHIVKANANSAPPVGEPDGENMNRIAIQYQVRCRDLYLCNRAILRRKSRSRLGTDAGKSARISGQGEWVSPRAPLKVGLRLAIPKGGAKLLHDWRSPPKHQRIARTYRCHHAFLSETIVVALLSKVHCPHIVRYDGICFQEHAAYIVMERLEGNLRDAFRNNPRRYGTLRTVKALVWQCCVAILAMQTSYRIVHYDLNAYNIFLSQIPTKDDAFHAYDIVDDAGQLKRFCAPNVGAIVKLGDFGFAGAFMLEGPHVVRDDVRSQRFAYKYNIANGFQQGYDVLFLLSCIDFALRRHIYKRIRDRVEIVAIKHFMNQLASDMSQAMQRDTSRSLPLKHQCTMREFVDETCHHETLRPRRRYSLLASPRDVLYSDAYADYRRPRAEARLLWRET